ncbi:hypothetical protein P9869_35950 [Streptomyces ossamyceticus]|nr:hypothetical protein [Streptomyces ossamyceticus]
MRIRKGHLTAGAVAVAATLLATSTPASASSDEHWWKETGVKVLVEERGDWVTVWDTKDDRKKVGVTVFVKGKKRYTLWADDGPDDSHYQGAAYGKPFDLPEGAKISLSMWRGSQPDTTPDHSWVNDH